jgi:hypothetical protein
MSARRFNTDKLQLSLVPPSLVQYTAAVMMFGAVKYDKHNWRKGFDYTSIIDSLERHIAAFKAGENYDPESGLHHLGHVACNVAFLIEHIEQGYGTDDRFNVPNAQPQRLQAQRPSDDTEGPHGTAT